MKFFKNNIIKIIIASLIFPLVLSIMGIFVNKSMTSVWQALGDLVVFLIAYFLNIKYFKQRIFWINTKNLGSQIYTALPGIIVVGLLNLPVIFLPGFQVKINIILICLLVGLAEEFIFRGVLIGLFLKVFHNNPLNAVVGSSIMFGLIHVINLKSLPIGYVSVQILFAAAIGILFGTIYIKTHNIVIVILLHALRDMFPMFSSKVLLQMNNVSFSMASLYSMIVFLLIIFTIAYIQLRDYKVSE